MKSSINESKEMFMFSQEFNNMRKRTDEEITRTFWWKLYLSLKKFREVFTELQSLIRFIQMCNPLKNYNMCLKINHKQCGVKSHYLELDDKTTDA